LDARKAFDRLPHRIVINKLHALGVPQDLTEWLSHFLAGRSFKVRIGSEVSKSRTAKGGTPQGSPLSVPLWHVFFADIPDIDAYFFMDDICVFGNSDRSIQEQLDDLNQWARTNELQWNLDKCFILPVNKAFKPQVSLAGSVLQTVNCARYLGILFSSNENPSQKGFAFHDEALKVISIIKSRMNWLKLLKFSPPSIRIDAFRALIQSRITFSIQFLREHIEDIEKAQRQSLRFLASTLPGVPWTRLYQLFQVKPIDNLFWSSWPKHFAAWTILPDDSPQQATYRKWKVGHMRRYDETPLSYMRWSEGLTSSIISDQDKYEFANYDSAGMDQRRAAYSVNLPITKPKKDTWSKEVLSTGKNSTFAHCWTDGSWCNEQLAGGTGIMLEIRNQGRVTMGTAHHPILSSYAVELKALEEGAEALSNQLPFAPQPNLCVNFYTDSGSLVSGFKGWSSNGVHKVHEFKLNILDSFDSILAKGYRINLIWVPGHAGIEGNELADKTARAALRNLEPISCPLGKDFFVQARKRISSESKTEDRLTPRRASTTVLKFCVFIEALLHHHNGGTVDHHRGPHERLTLDREV
jgi:ribonuclease HI